MTWQDLQFDVSGSIATITLDRPAARNAYSDAMIDGLVRAFAHADDDADVRCIVLTGNGPAFHAGGDVKQMREQEGMFAGTPAELRERYVRGIQRVPRCIASTRKPIIAAINGAAIGAGLDLACMCDLRIAADSAKFASTFVRIGLVPGDGGALFLPRVIGFPAALELMLSARVIDATEALSMGLVHRVVPSAELGHAARAWAETIVANAPLAVEFTKRLAYRSRHMTLEDALELAATYQGVVQNTDDHREGVKSLLERRSPKFHGR